MLKFFIQILMGKMTKKKKHQQRCKRGHKRCSVAQHNNYYDYDNLTEVLVFFNNDELRHDLIGSRSGMANIVSP